MNGQGAAATVPVVTVFERIPDAFVELYDAKFKTWARQFRQIGTVATFKFVKPVEPIPLAKDQRRCLGVRLTAEVDRSKAQMRVIIRPQTLADEDMIKRHCFDMRH